MLIDSFCLSMNYLTVEGKSLSAIHEGPRCPQIRETTKRSKCVWALPSSAWEMLGTLIKEAWQLGVQPGFTAHSRASYTGPGALRDANYYPVRSWTGKRCAQGLRSTSQLATIVLSCAHGGQHYESFQDHMRD